MQGTFKRSATFEKRRELSTRIREEHPNRIPVIVEQAPGNRRLGINKHKFLVPIETSIGGFLNELRKLANVSSHEAIFIFCGEGSGILVPTSNTIVSTYERYKDDDGFLYITVALENTFGVLDTILGTSASIVKRVSTLLG